MTQSDIRVKSYCHLIVLRTLSFNSERLYILRDSIRHPSKKLLSFEFISELQHSILSVSIYYETQLDIRVKSYCRLNMLRASTFNYERLDILRHSIRHPSKNLLSFEFDQSFGIQFRVSRHITGLNRTSE